MIDGTLLTIIPPIIASLVTYGVAMKRSKLVQLKTISEIQSKAIDLVQKAEEEMRIELRKEIERIREENDELRKKIQTLEDQRNASDQLSNTLKEEIKTLRDALDHYRKLVDENNIVMESNRKELDHLRQVTSTGKKKYRD